MNRRHFILASALMPTLWFGNNLLVNADNHPQVDTNYALRNYPHMIRVMESFPDTPIVNGINLYRTDLWITKYQSHNSYQLTAETHYINSTERFQLDKIFLEDDIEVIDFKNSNNIVPAIMLGANKIAAKTRRSKGNHYAVFENHVLIWYSSKTIAEDTPVRLVGSNAVYSSKYKDYFIRVNHNKFTNDDHAALHSLGMIRI